MLLLNFVLTINSLVMKLVKLSFTSEGLNEDPLIHTMHTMTANSNWIPYQKFMVHKKLQKCIDFSNICAQLPFGFSYGMGYFDKIKFNFSDWTFKDLVYDLEAWVADATDEE